MTSVSVYGVLFFVFLINNANANVNPFPDLVLQEVVFSGGNVGTSSVYSSSASWAATNAFQQSEAYWHSGRDHTGNGHLQPFPHLIWYDFRTGFVPGRVSFRPRIGKGCDPGQCGATKWQFIGTNDEECNRYSKWTVLCEDLSGKAFERQGQSKYCTVDDAKRKSFRCLGISVLDTSYGGQSEVSLGGIKMWRKVLEES